MLRQCRHIFLRSLRNLTIAFTDAGTRRILWMPLVAFSLPSRNEAQLRQLASISFMSLYNGIVNEATKNNLAWRLHIVDKCLDAGLYSVAREILEDEEKQCVEVLWRLGKTMYLLYEEEVNPEYKKELLLKGSERLQQALQINDKLETNIHYTIINVCRLIYFLKFYLDYRLILNQYKCLENYY